MQNFIQTVLVPQGAEYQAVLRGIKSIKNPPQVVAIPVGAIPVQSALEKLKTQGYFYQNQRVLVMGLCGSLTANFQVGDRILYHSIMNTAQEVLTYDKKLLEWIQNQLKINLKIATGLMCDRILWSAQEKQEIAKQYPAQVVDMEGFTILSQLQSLGVSVAMLRVVSDNATHDIPNLNSAISPAGNLQPFSLALQMLRQPIAATRLISGSLKGLKQLQQVSFNLFEK